LLSREAEEPGCEVRLRGDWRRKYLNDREGAEKEREGRRKKEVTT